MNPLVALLTGILSAIVLPGPGSDTGRWPMNPEPEVVAGFEPPPSPYTAGHRGVDLAGRPGQGVHAAASGRVSFAGMVAGRSVVVVAHGHLRTTYEPVRASVEVGTLVEAGGLLGTLAAFPSHCAPAACLHWGLLDGHTYLDPLTLLGAGPVRLLPLFGEVPSPDDTDRGDAPLPHDRPAVPGPDLPWAPGRHVSSSSGTLAR